MVWAGFGWVDRWNKTPRRKGKEVSVHTATASILWPCACVVLASRPSLFFLSQGACVCGLGDGDKG